MSFEVIRTDGETNVLGAMRVITSALPLLERSPSPRIANVSTDTASLTLRTGTIMAAYALSKTMLNAVTVQYARRVEGTGILINAVRPGYVASDIAGHRGTRTPGQGAAISIRFATLPDDGPTGGFYNEDGVIPW